jgi:hypothetical protein
LHDEDKPVTSLESGHWQFLSVNQKVPVSNQRTTAIHRTRKAVTGGKRIIHLLPKRFDLSIIVLEMTVDAQHIRAWESHRRIQVLYPFRPPTDRSFSFLEMLSCCRNISFLTISLLFSLLPHLACATTDEKIKLGNNTIERVSTFESSSDKWIRHLGALRERSRWPAAGNFIG